MSYFFNSKHLNKALQSCSRLLKILQPTAIEDFVCPYDGMVLSSDHRPTDYFLNLVMPACYCDQRWLPKSRYYKYVLCYRYFIVQWEPIYGHCPYTMIYINPSVNRLTAAQVLDLLKFIVGDYQCVYVNAHDDKVDISGFTPQEIAMRIYVGYVKSTSRCYKGTYYIGSRIGQFIRIYDKASHLGISGKLVRIERRIRYKRKNDRPLLTDFLHSSRSDAFKHVVIVDLSALKWSSRFGRKLRQYGTFMNAYRGLSFVQQQGLRRSPIFSNPLLDLRLLFQSDLASWMSLTPHLQQKVLQDKLEWQMTSFFKVTRPKYSHISAFSLSSMLLTSIRTDYNRSLQYMFGGSTNGNSRVRR
jgi:hypothetical protein